MPPIGRPKSASGRPADGSDEPTGDASREAELDVLVTHCLEAHAIIAEHGTPVMRRLIDLLLFEIASEIGGSFADADLNRELN